MSCRAVTAWLFGKLPSHGDFIARGLEATRRDELDRWLSAEMLRARDSWGEAFEARYDAAPPWRFASPEEGRVICASIDAAGRRFPVIAGLCVREPASAAAAAEACEEAVYRAFSHSMTADAVWHLLSAVELEAGEPPGVSGWWLDGSEVRSAGDWPEGLLTNMLAVDPT